MSKIELPPEPKPTFLWDRPEYPHFTADQLRARDRQIVEVCAKACDALVMALDHGGNEYRREATASQCAAAIRNLIEESNNG